MLIYLDEFFLYKLFRVKNYISVVFCFNELLLLLSDEAEHGARVHALPGQRKAQEDRHTRPGEGWLPGGKHCQVDTGTHRGPGQIIYKTGFFFWLQDNLPKKSKKLNRKNLT